MYVRHVKPLLRTETREKVIYAQDMYGTAPAGDIDGDPTKGLTGQSIRWRYAPNVNRGVCGDVKVPNDRVLGTPISFRFVFSIDAGPGGNVVFWRLDILIVGNQELISGTPTVMGIEATTKGAAGLVKASDPIVIPAAELDGKAQPIQLQLAFIRWGRNVNDTEPANADLYKVIMEYQAYV